jgi:hypothetical protein
VALPLAWVALAAVGGACNAISGVGDLDFSAGGSGQGGGAVTGSSIASSAASVGSGGAGGSGGSSCGACITPPNVECYEPVGTCVGGECEYEPLAFGEGCDDGSACTLTATCDGSGQCVSGPDCPSDGTCHLDGACVDDACVFPSAPDGTLCGGTPADVCCGGACTDISTDELNCGGCGFACDPAEGCQSVEATNGCEVHPANTSARCTCPGVNAKCPDGLICRTVTPYNNLCSPDPASCPAGATFVEVNFCPNYCFY